MVLGPAYPYLYIFPFVCEAAQINNNFKTDCPINYWYYIIKIVSLAYYDLWFGYSLNFLESN